MRRLARTLIIVLALAGLALPASAADCLAGEITWQGSDPGWHPELVEVTGVRADIVGEFLWVQYGADPVDEYDGTVSVEIPGDASGASVCPDGTVTFAYSNNVQVDEPEPASVDLVAVWADWIDLTPRLRFGAF